MVVAIKESAWQGRAGGMDRSLASLDMDVVGFGKDSTRLKPALSSKNKGDLPPIKDALKVKNK